MRAPPKANGGRLAKTAPAVPLVLFGERCSASRGDALRARLRYKGGFAAVALGLALLSAGGLAVCWMRYSPWQHRWPLEPETRRLEGSPIVLEVPASLWRFIRIGGGPYAPVAPGDPVRVEIEAERQPLPAEEGLAAERDALERSWRKRGRIRRPELTNLGPRRVLRAAILREEPRPLSQADVRRPAHIGQRRQEALVSSPAAR